MMDFLRIYHPLFDIFLLNVGYAYSQQVVLRAGVFSVATAAFAALGAYCSAILTLYEGFPEFLALSAALLLGLLSSLLISLPLSRLRGVYQAIATLAFVEVTVAMLIYADGLTGGAAGVSGIPRLTNTWQLLIAVAVVIYIMHSIGRSGVGRAFDAIRQDEIVGVTLGVSVRKYHMLAFGLSGAIAGLFGGLQALLVYSIEPRIFAFDFLTTTLTFIVLGGRRTTLGPIVGTAIIVALPEMVRPFADNRQLAQGVLMMLMMAYLPNGAYDTVVLYIRRWRTSSTNPYSWR